MRSSGRFEVGEYSNFPRKSILDLRKPAIYFSLSPQTGNKLEDTAEMYLTMNDGNPGTRIAYRGRSGSGLSQLTFQHPKDLRLALLNQQGERFQLRIVPRPRSCFPAIEF